MNGSTGNNDEMSYDVFLCHSSEDKAEVRQIYEALKVRGLKPWIDEVDLKPGDRWRSKIEEALKSARTVAVLLGRRRGGFRIASLT